MQWLCVWINYLSVEIYFTYPPASLLASLFGATIQKTLELFKNFVLKQGEYANIGLYNSVDCVPPFPMDT